MENWQPWRDRTDQWGVSEWVDWGQGARKVCPFGVLVSAIFFFLGIRQGPWNEGKKVWREENSVAFWLALELGSSFYDLPWGEKKIWFLWLMLGKERDKGTDGEKWVISCFPGPSSLCQFKVYSKPPCHTSGYHVLRTSTSRTAKKSWCLVGRRCGQMKGHAMNETVH